jgi:AraC-like DNA-binding protein/mannose-6-phosphate isomerase-like protein (cupin superfamily)
VTLYSNDKFLESPDFLFHVQVYDVGPEQVIAPHSHEFIEFVYIREGTGEHEYQGEKYSVSQGDVFMIEPGETHAYRVERGQRLRVVNVLFGAELLASELRALSGVTSFVDFFYMEPFLRTNVRFQSKLTLASRQRLFLDDLLERLLAEYLGKESGYRFLIKTKLLELFIMLSRMYEKSRNKPLAALGDDGQIIEHICGYIRLHHARPMSLEQAAHMCGMSQSKFTSAFRKYAGKSFLEYRNEIRIGVAEQLLAETNEKVIRIAAEVGFEDLSHFNRLFKQLKGISPGQYRRKTDTRESGRSDAVQP